MTIRLNGITGRHFLHYVQSDDVDTSGARYILRISMENTFRIAIEEMSNINDVQFVEQQLTSFNRQYTSADEYKPLNIFLRNNENAIIGGLLGETYWHWLHIRVLWIDEHYRNQGLGKKILGEAEKEAINRGCNNVHLDTHDFQAEEFYKKNGYVIFGTLDGLPEGHQRMYMKKAL